MEHHIRECIRRTKRAFTTNQRVSINIRSPYGRLDINFDSPTSRESTDDFEHRVHEYFHQVGGTIGALISRAGKPLDRVSSRIAQSSNFEASQNNDGPADQHAGIPSHDDVTEESACPYIEAQENGQPSSCHAIKPKPAT